MVSIPEGKAQQRIRDAFGQHGVSEDRIQIMPRIPLQAYLRLHSKIDLMLDPFPYNGVTTTLQSLWMGVPVLTLKGARYPTRVGASILANMGLHSFIAHDSGEYVNKGARFAADPSCLKALRAGMRERMLASPMLDERCFTRDLEALYLRASAATRSAALRNSAMFADAGWLKLF
jgi:predicted O-linked N-acetylglucosamine transferase (SPINDLY family)